MGIITGFALGRGATGGPDLDIQTEVLKTHLRHAQSRAMNSNIHWGLRTDAVGGSYWLFRYDGSVTTVRLPGEDADTVDLSADGITMSAGTYTFDSRGIPYYAGHSDTPPGTTLAGLGGDQSVVNKSVVCEWRETTASRSCANRHIGSNRQRAIRIDRHNVSIVVKNQLTLA